MKGPERCVKSGKAPQVQRESYISYNVKTLDDQYLTSNTTLSTCSNNSTARIQNIFKVIVSKLKQLTSPVLTLSLFVLFIMHTFSALLKNSYCMHDHSIAFFFPHLHSGPARCRDNLVISTKIQFNV